VGQVKYKEIILKLVKNLLIILLLFSLENYAFAALIDKIVKKSMDKSNKVYIEYYIQFPKSPNSLIFYYTLSTTKILLEAPEAHGIAGYDQYKDILLKLKSIDLKYSPEVSLAGNGGFYIYIFRSYNNSIVDNLLYTIEICADHMSGILITKYNDKNEAVMKEYYQYNEQIKIYC
jgi:hypothetical protein